MENSDAKKLSMMGNSKSSTKFKSTACDPCPGIVKKNNIGVKLNPGKHLSGHLTGRQHRGSHPLGFTCGCPSTETNH